MFSLYNMYIYIWREREKERDMFSYEWSNIMYVVVDSGCFFMNAVLYMVGNTNCIM